jgi:hypothetical protein
VYFAGGFAKEVDNGILMFVVFCLNRDSDYSVNKNSTTNANNRVKIFYKFAKRVIVNNIKGIIAGNNKFN